MLSQSTNDHIVGKLILVMSFGMTLKIFLKNIKMMIGNIFLVRLLLVMIQMNKTALILLMGSSV